MADRAVQKDLIVRNGIQAGQTITITGKTNRDAKRFTVNLKSGKGEEADVPLHFDVRISMNDNNRQVLVLNSFAGFRWGKEQRSTTSFPFGSDQNFDIVIRVEDDSYEISSGGSQWEYKHRLSYNTVTYIDVTGDCSISCLDVD